MVRTKGLTGVSLPETAHPKLQRWRSHGLGVPPVTANARRSELAVTDPLHKGHPLRSGESEVRPGWVVGIAQCHSTVAKFSHLHTLVTCATLAALAPGQVADITRV